jgi:hypothetical protein
MSFRRQMIEQARLSIASWTSARRSALGADEESSEALGPGEGAFDRPTDLAQAGAVLDATSGDDRGDAAGADQAAVLVVVVAPVGVEPAWSATRLADHAPDRRHGVEQRDQLGDVACGCRRSG